MVKLAEEASILRADRKSSVRSQGCKMEYLGYILHSDGSQTAFEFDTEKSSLNLAKHGIDFVEAQRLWLDHGMVEGEARIHPEPRKLAIARIDGVIWTAVVTVRASRIRIISVRRSRQREAALYGR